MALRRAPEAPEAPVPGARRPLAGDCTHDAACPAGRRLSTSVADQPQRLRDSGFDEDDFDDEPELSFEELLQQAPGPGGETEASRVSRIGVLVARQKSLTRVVVVE